MDNESTKLKKSFLSAAETSVLSIDTALTSLKSAAIDFNYEKMQTTEVKIDDLGKLMQVTEMLFMNKMKFELIREQIDHPQFLPAIKSLSKLIKDLQCLVLQTRLVPIRFLFTNIARMIHGLVKQQEIELIIEGCDIEVDYSLIDILGTAIVRLIQNAIEHGIENPTERLANNKSMLSIICLRASCTTETAIIEITDDGAGLDLDTIKKIAIKQNLVEPHASHEEIINTIFLGISTKYVTAATDRDRGLCIVKQKIESVGGTIKVKSMAGKGTSFFIEVPLTRASMQTLLIKVADEIYAIPLAFVERVLVVDPDNCKELFETETLVYQDTDIPVICLSTLFGLPRLNIPKQPVAIIRKGEERLGLIVDALLSTQELINKPLVGIAQNNKYFSGAALIEAGQMILTLNVARFFAR